MGKSYMVCLEYDAVVTQHEYIRVEAEDEEKALDKAEDILDERFPDGLDNAELSIVMEK